jgi:hypothetical protein
MSGRNVRRTEREREEEEEEEDEEEDSAGDQQCHHPMSGVLVKIKKSNGPLSGKNYVDKKLIYTDHDGDI